MRFRIITQSAVALCFVVFLANTVTLAESRPNNGSSSVDPVRSPQIASAIERGRKSIEKSTLFQSCMAEMLRETGPKLCEIENPRGALRAVRAGLQASGNQLYGLTPHDAVDPAPWATLIAIEVEEDKIDDLAGLVDGDVIPGDIERCSDGFLGTGCTVLRSTCLGDFKCYGDGTCACYTCKKGGIPGSCGIKP